MPVEKEKKETKPLTMRDRMRAQHDAAREKHEDIAALRMAAKQSKPAQAQARTYVVQAGDSLSKIAKSQLGDAGRWPEIFELNQDQLKDPDAIQPGQELRLPA